MKIMIKPMYGDLREVDIEQAQRYAVLLYNHIKNVTKHEDKMRIVQERIQGIKVEELLGGKNGTF